MAIITAREILWIMIFLRISRSWPNHRVDVLAITMDWAPIILSITPPALLADAITCGSKPSGSPMIFSICQKARVY
ncbi:MAG TPA: hypothetical protein VMW28_05000 [Pelolinea sp.]|nr:hypothetical protein [Pelolinea sp.]